MEQSSITDKTDNNIVSHITLHLPSAYEEPLHKSPLKVKQAKKRPET